MIYDSENFPELPETWVSACVNDVFAQVSTSNKQIKTKEALAEGRFPVVDQGAQLVSGYSNDEEKCINASIAQPIFLFGDHTRTLKKITTQFVPGADGTKLLQATSVLNSDYAFGMLRAVKLPDRGYSRHFQFLRDAQIPLAPLPEQKRIADKLDATLARVDACRERLARVAPIIKRFRQSVLAAATSGRLTADWRAQQGHGHENNDDNVLQGNTHLGQESDSSTDNTHPSENSSISTTLLGWREVVFSEIVSESLVGLVRPSAEQSEYESNGVFYLKMNNIGEQWGSSTEKKVYVTCSQDEFDRYKLRVGDWLFNTRNSAELVGKSCVWRGEAAVFNNNILRVRFKGGVCPDFIEIYFRSPQGRKALESVKSATTSVAAIYQRSLLVQKVPLPDLSEQTEIVRRVETLFAFADRLEARLAGATSAAERLTPSLLAKAFRGELVPQDPSDEPASELLKRLAAQREAVGSKPKRGRKAST